MLRDKRYQKLFSGLLTGLYLFVVLFAQNLHDHGSGHLFKEFHFQGKGKTFTKSSLEKSAGDCMSCHFASENNPDVPEILNISFVHFPVSALPSQDVQSVYLYKNRELSTQRGPPSLA